MFDDHHGLFVEPSGTERLCRACIERTGVGGGGVAVLSGQGSSVLVHASDAVARAVSDLQFTLGQGPSVDAIASGVPVLVPDVGECAPYADRWPALLPELEALDVHAVFAFLIRVGAVALGTLDLYRHAEGGLSGAQVEIGMTAGTAIGETLVSGDRPGERAVSYPMSVHRAAGMVMVQLGTSIDDALVRLRATAFEEGVAVTTVASEVLDGVRSFTEEDV